MKLDFRQRLLATTLLVGASMVATPAFAQEVDPEGTPQPPDTSAVPTTPDTIGPAEGLSTVPTTTPEGAPVRAAGQDIIVTGSRIPQPNLESASPVTVVTSQEVKLAGTSRTEDLINSLPQVFAGQGSNVSNGASGTATINLRGLGSVRTLVLVNGKRLQAGDTGNPVADINFIPSQLVKRVDVLTGGASSVYGADAVAGVVNFIIDTTYTGFRIDGQASVFNHYNDTSDDVLLANEARGFLPPRGWSTNGGAQDIAGMWGAAFDDGRGHVMAYATYRSQDAVLESTRDYSFCALQATSNPAAAGRRFNCGGSGTSAVGTFLTYDPVTFTNIGTFQVSGNEFIPGATPFNYAPYNYYQRPDERYNLGAFGDYEITPAFKPYVELMFMDDRSNAVIAPSGDFGNTNRIACDNALLSDQQRTLLCTPRTVIRNGVPVVVDPVFVGTLNGMEGVEQTYTYILRRNVEGGGRDSDLRHNAWRIVAGMRGDAARGISYDAYYQRGRTHDNTISRNDFSVTRLNRAIDVVAVDADGNIVAPGTPDSTNVCRSVVTGIDPTCVPWNIFTQGAVDPAALAYLQTPGFSTGLIDQTIAHIDATIAGDEYGVRMPWAETGLGVNIGAEYRKERLDFEVDVALQSGDLAGSGGPTPPTSGEFDVREVFAEIQIPIVQRNFIEEFIVSAGYRFSNYHVGGDSFNTDTYKLEAELAPIRDIRFRGSYNRAVRAPNIVELFFPQALGLAGEIDPCANQPETGAPLATLAQCQLTGVSATQYGNISSNPAAQYNATFGGNPNLTPEVADSWTVGAVIQPRFIPGLALTADYWNIEIENIIGTLGYDQVLFGCMGFGDIPQDTSLCSLVQRAPGTGSLWLGTQGFVVLTNVNQSGVGLKTSGFDFQATYSRRLGGLGTANVSFVGTLLDSLKVGLAQTECVGLFAGTCGTPNPKWRHVMRAGLTMPSGLGFSARWRHFSGVDAVTAAGPGEERFSSRDYFDLTFTARLAQRLNLRLGANNIFDTDPPLGGSNIPAGFGNGNTFPQVYDSMGRYLFAGFTVDF